MMEKGFTLLETMICIAVLGILLSTSLPGLSNFIDRNRTRKLATQYLHAINLARTTAITSQQIITFCKSNNNKQCQGQWHLGSIVFIDKNANGKVEDGEDIIYSIEEALNAGSIRWRAFQNKQYIQMTPLGSTNYQNGNFTFCPLDNDIRLAHQIVVNRTGRARVAIDSNNDGVRERSNGSPLRCP